MLGIPQWEPFQNFCPDAGLFFKYVRLVFDTFRHILVENVVYFEYLLPVHICHVLELLSSLRTVKRAFTLGLFQ